MGSVVPGLIVIGMLAALWLFLRWLDGPKIKEPEPVLTGWIEALVNGRPEKVPDPRFWIDRTGKAEKTELEQLAENFNVTPNEMNRMLTAKRRPNGNRNRKSKQARKADNHA